MIYLCFYHTRQLEVLTRQAVNTFYYARFKDQRMFYEIGLESSYFRQKKFLFFKIFFELTLMRIEDYLFIK